VVSSTAADGSRPDGLDPSWVCTRCSSRIRKPAPGCRLASRNRAAFEPRSIRATSSAITSLREIGREVESHDRCAELIHFLSTVKRPIISRQHNIYGLIGLSVTIYCVRLEPAKE